MKKTSLIASILLVFALVLAACSTPSNTNGNTQNGQGNSSFPSTGLTNTQTVTGTAGLTGTTNITGTTGISGSTGVTATSGVTSSTALSPTLAPMTSTVSVSPTVGAETTVTPVITSTTSMTGTAPQGNLSQVQIINLSDLLKAKVYGQDNSQIGTVSDVIIDLAAGKATYVMVRFDPSIGTAGEMTMVPWAAFQIQNNGQPGAANYQLMLNVDVNALKTAPSFKQSSLPDFTVSGWDTDIQSYWADKLPAQPQSAATPEAEALLGATGMSGSVRASEMLTEKLVGPNSQQIGQISDVLIDAQTGFVRYVVLHAAPALGLGDKMIPVPLQLLKQPAPGQGFTVPFDQSMLQMAPNIDMNTLDTAAAQGWDQAIITFWKAIKP